MDVQGSQYHLLHGQADWARCTDTGHAATLGDFWALDDEGVPSTPDTSLTFDDTQDVLRLRREIPLFHRAGRTLALDQSARRGAGADSYGNWYWIGPDRASILWRQAGGDASATWWSAGDEARSCARDNSAAPAGAFLTCAPAWAPDLVLSGLAVTTRHYLLAGYLEQRTPSEESEAGLLVFDLQAGGGPLRMPWPAQTRFEPWDMTETPDGGALVLDRAHATYWRLDEHLRVRGSRSQVPALFQPAADGSAAEFAPGEVAVVGGQHAVAGPWLDAHRGDRRAQVGRGERGTDDGDLAGRDRKSVV